jgi:hypothetical protein
VSFAAVNFCVASERVFIVVSVYFFMTQSGNVWIHPRTCRILGGPKFTHQSKSNFRFHFNIYLYIFSVMSRRKLGSNITMHFRETGWEVTD